MGPLNIIWHCINVLFPVIRILHPAAHSLPSIFRVVSHSIPDILQTVIADIPGRYRIEIASFRGFTYEISLMIVISLSMILIPLFVSVMPGQDMLPIDLMHSRKRFKSYHAEGPDMSNHV
jgi:hypothetical protein